MPPSRINHTATKRTESNTHSIIVSSGYILFEKVNAYVQLLQNAQKRNDVSSHLDFQVYLNVAFCYPLIYFYSSCKWYELTDWRNNFSRGIRFKTYIFLSFQWEKRLVWFILSVFILINEICYESFKFHSHDNIK